jgi:glycosyltransferase involved in cell wall biosynthesis
MTNLKILWHSVAPFYSSGYGIVTKNLALKIGQDYPSLISTYYGLLPGSSLRIAGVRIFPTVDTNAGEKSVRHYISKFDINLPILCSDFWPFMWFTSLPNSTCYGPIDSYDYTPQEETTLRAYKNFIPCSEFGGQVYEKITGRKPLAVIPHGVDTSIFKPDPERTANRLMFNFPPKKFIIGIVAANNDTEPRKGWDDIFLCLQEFFRKFPKERKNVMIFANTKPVDPRGYNLPEVAKKCGLGKNVLFPEHLAQMCGLPDPEMAKLYSTFDILLNASRREGFCLPILEAQACGIPVVASRTSAIPELVEGHGWLVNMGDPMFSPAGWKCERVDKVDLVKNLEEAYFNKEKRLKFGIEASKFALRYDWNKLYSENWKPLLASLDSKIRVKKFK